ncbi:MAG TPA: SDR family NAD(P)-dependent oxidoreductase [Acidimicrobiales bacterium]|nr:SDR family NAD(P)-dependent oxidoreductase [Acidimicrobiales bacterium]
MAVAIVTGASRGLGRALAIGLAAEGWDLVVDARAEGPLQEAARRAEEFGARVRAVAGDVGDPAHRWELVKAATAMGSLGLLVNNAGSLGPSPLPALSSVDVEAMGQLFMVNVLAPLALVQLALPALRANHGTAVAVTSDAAADAYEGWGPYGASKAALEQLHHVLATEEPDVVVIRFDPGDMWTQMHQEAFPGEDISDRSPPEVAAAALLRLLASTPASGRYHAAELVEQVA